MGVTSQQLTPQSTGQVTIMGEDITATTQGVDIMEGILAEVTLVGGITNLHWEKAGARDVRWSGHNNAARMVRNSGLSVTAWTHAVNEQAGAVLPGEEKPRSDEHKHLERTHLESRALGRCHLGVIVLPAALPDHDLEDSAPGGLH